MINCIAIDDEPLALQLVQEYCSKISFLKLDKIFTNTDEAKKQATGTQAESNRKTQ